MVVGEQWVGGWCVVCGVWRVVAWSVIGSSVVKWLVCSCGGWRAGVVGGVVVKGVVW